MADTTNYPPLSRQSVLDARERIKQYVHQTPVLTSNTLDHLATSGPIQPSSNPTTDHLDLSKLLGREGGETIRIFFKCENYQRIGAFKARGAFHALSRIPANKLTNGVVTHSSGNHAAALALAAKTFGVKAYIVMPKISRPSKIAATMSHGPKVHFSGSTSEQREEVTRRVIADTGALLVPPYDHPDIIAGQGTMGVELQEQIEELLGAGRRLDAVLTPCGGGGMLSGVALAFQGTGTHVFGAEPNFEGANDAERGLSANPPKRVESVSTLTIADGLRTPLGTWNWGIISDTDNVKGVYSVNETAIKGATRLIIERIKTFVEPSAAVALAVVLFNDQWRQQMRKLMGNKKEWNIGIVLSGGNATMESIIELFGTPHDTTRPATKL